MTRAAVRRLSRVMYFFGMCSLWGIESRANEIEVLDLKTLVVTATAYNSVRAQTDRTPTLTAWGYRLKPGMKVVAVSRDLIRHGLTHGAWLVIDGVPGVFRVLDKMASRWRKRIDIYMGLDIAAARKWGRRKVRIWYEDYSKEGLAKIKQRLLKSGRLKRERGLGPIRGRPKGEGPKAYGLWPEGEKPKGTGPRPKD